MLLDVAKAGQRLVAVGERGIVLLSDDGGVTWRQTQVPTSMTLTALTFKDARLGWVVGHGGILLQTQDGGKTWNRHLDGKKVADMILKDAQESVAKSPDSKTAQALLDNARNLVEQGAIHPFLDIYFHDEDNGFIIGAYGLILRTKDGGRTWMPWLSKVDNPYMLHYYTICGKGTKIYMAGEQGLFYRSLDSGDSFEKIETPYGGSYFASVLTEKGDVVIAGLQGNIFRSKDDGISFEQIIVPDQITVNTMCLLRNGRVLVMNQLGQLLMLHDEKPEALLLQQKGPPATAWVEIDDGWLVSVGFQGVFRYSEPLSLSRFALQRQQGDNQ
ncbi:MAG: hypothetical protein HKP58_10040 [Desulfatitalea sp.]|nr:hypothetical protein [Desulfatitalea sp.]NNK00741.1 hypothetical protein [Desulfatitalea sp.]